METKEYFEKVMQHYNQHRNGRSLRKYCKDEAIDYDWLLAFKKNYPARSEQRAEDVTSQSLFVPLSIAEEKTLPTGWQVTRVSSLMFQFLVSKTMYQSVNPLIITRSVKYNLA